MRYLRGDGGGDAPLGVAVEHLPLAVIDVFHGRGQADAAVVAGQQARFFHLLDVAAHGLRRHVQLLGQLFDGHGDLLAHHFEQAALAGIQNHGLVSLKITKRTKTNK
ncbi:hypothetical protein D9M68_959110 [compost metagenome]